VYHTHQWANQTNNVLLTVSIDKIKELQDQIAELSISSKKSDND
jgi:hypothetical protein